MLALLHSTIDRGEHEKYLFLPLYGNTENPLVTVCTPKIDYTVKRQKGDSTSLSVLSHNLENDFKPKDSVLNTSAITAVTKSSMKPRSGATTNRHLRGSGERNQEQRRAKVNFGRTMMQALELQRLAKRHNSGRSNVEQ